MLWLILLRLAFLFPLGNVPEPAERPYHHVQHVRSGCPGTLPECRPAGGLTP